MRYLRSVFALILSTLMLLGGSTLTAFAADIPSELTILFTHDTHDHFLPAREEGGGEYGGYVRLATLLKEERAAAARPGGAGAERPAPPAGFRQTGGKTGEREGEG